MRPVPRSSEPAGAFGGGYDYEDGDGDGDGDGEGSDVIRYIGISNAPGSGGGDGHGWGNDTPEGDGDGIGDSNGRGGYSGERYGLGKGILGMTDDMARRTERVFLCAGCIGAYECPIHGRRL